MSKIKIMALTLIGVLLMNTAGMLIILKSLQWKVRLEMQEKKTQKKGLLTFEFSNETFRKIAVRNGKEIDWKNKRYDIVKITLKHNKVHVLAFLDDKETQLIKFIGQWLKQSKNKQDCGHEITYALTMLLFCFPPMPSPVMPNSDKSIITFYDCYLVHHADFIPSAIQPPPKISC